MKIKEVIPSEYKAVILAEDGSAWADGWVTGTGAKLLQYKGTHKFIAGNGGLYNTLLLKDNGDVYVNNPKSQDLTFLQNDAQESPFKAVAVECQMRTYFAIRTDGTIWMQGYNSSKWFGSDANLVLNKWNKIPGQPAVKFKALVKGIQLVALTEDGTVFTLADGSTNWVKKTLPGKVERILANGNGVYLAIVNGLPIGWGQSRYLTGVAATISSYKELAADWGITEPLQDIAINDNTIHFITSDGKLYGFGDNAQGEVGCRWELVNRKELYKGTQYVWNWVNAIQPNYQKEAFVSKPTHIRTDKLFKRVFGGGTYSYYKYAQDNEDNLYSWGRNKSLVLANGIAISNESIYPNALDVLAPTLVDPFSYVLAMPQEFTPGAVTAGQDQIIEGDTATLSGLASPAHSKGFSYKIEKYEWKQISGPSCTIGTPTNAQTVVKGMSNGAYIFELKVTDNNGATMTDQVSISVTIKNNAPVVYAGCDQLVIGKLTVLTGSVQDNDGTVISYKWEKVSGPEGDVIATPLSITTDISFSNAGIYVYRLTAVDDKGASSSDDVTLTVWKIGGNNYVILDKN